MMMHHVRVRVGAGAAQRARCHRHQPLRPTSTSACTSATAAASTTHDSLRTSSLLLLLHESFKRAADRPLLEVTDLLRLPAALDAMACCVLIVEPAGRTTAAAAATSSAVSESAADGGGSEHGFIVTYANAAAVHMLLGHSSLPRTETAADAGAAGAGAGAAATAARTGGGLCGSPLSTLLPHAPPGLLSMPAASTTGGLGRGAQAPRMAVYARVELQQQQQEPEQQQQQQRVQAEPGQGHGAAAEPASGSGMRACRADVLACDVCSPSGRTLGRALLFDRWHCASNGRSGRPLMRELTEAEVPGEATLQAAVKAVRAQADAVRSLKQARGLGNQHPDVINGVTQLAIAKAMASELAALAGAYARGDAGLLAPFVELCTQREQAQQAQQEQGSRD